MGHEHCNRVSLYGADHSRQGPLHAVGFAVGGTGMLGDGCSQFGFTVLQSDPGAKGGPNVRVDHFPLAEDPSFGADPGRVLDGFDRVFSCLNRSGYAGCRADYGLSYRATSPEDIVTPADLPPATLATP